MGGDAGAGRARKGDKKGQVRMDLALSNDVLFAEYCSVVSLELLDTCIG